MIRRFGEAVARGRHYSYRPGVYALLMLGRDVLLTFQQEPRPEYQFPGGGVDAGEQPLAALHREVLEETGWRIAAARRIGAYRRFAYMPEYDRWAEKLCTLYLARPVLAKGAPAEPGHSAVWTDVESAIRLLANDGESHALRLVSRQIGR